MSSFLLFNSIADLKQILYKEKCKRVLLVTGQRSFESSGAKLAVKDYLDGLDVLQFCEFETNPKFKDIINGIEKVSDFAPDLIIAIGGGSVLDIAKLLSVLPSDISLAKATIIGELNLLKKRIALVAIPTTAGSGSECTHFAVVYLDQKKYSVAHQELIPDYVILEPQLTYSMSPYLTAVTGIDAFSQAIESYWAVGATEESRSYAKEALKKILQVFPDMVQKPTPYSRKIMMDAAHMAGKAINISKTTGPHALSYIITMLYGLPHGHSVGLSLAEFFEYNLKGGFSEYNGNLNADSIELVRNELCSILQCDNIYEGKNRIKKILKDTGLPMKLTELGANNINSIKNIAKDVNLERLSNNPKKINKEKLISIIKNIW